MPRPKKEGGPAIHLTLRIPPDLHSRLTAAAGERGVAEEVRRRLEQSFSLGDDAKTRELLATVADLADSIERMNARPWFADAFSFRALRRGLPKVLDFALGQQPAGDAKINPEGPGAMLIYDETVTAEAFGDNLAATVITNRIERRSQS